MADQSMKTVREQIEEIADNTPFGEILTWSNDKDSRQKKRMLYDAFIDQIEQIFLQIVEESKPEKMGQLPMDQFDAVINTANAGRHAHDQAVDEYEAALKKRISG